MTQCGSDRPVAARRGLLLGTLALPFLGSASARAQGREIVISMSGGSFMDAVRSEVIEPFKAATGISVRMVSGNMKAHAMRLLSSRGQPPFDVFIGNDDDFVKLMDADRMMQLTPDRVPSIEEVHGKFKEQWQGYGSMFDDFSIGLPCNTQTLSDPPKSWREVVDRTAAGDFGNQVFCNSLPSGFRGQEVLVNLARALIGSDRVRLMATMITEHVMVANEVPLGSALAVVMVAAIFLLRGGARMLLPRRDG